MVSLKPPLTLRRLVRESPVGPALLDARALTSRHARRLSAPLRGAYNDAAAVLGFDGVAEPLSETWRRIVGRAQGALDEELPANATRVLIASGYGFSDMKLALETIFSVALRLRGAAPRALVCDAGMSACEFHTWGNFQPEPGVFGPALPRRAARATCDRCTDGQRAAFEQTRTPVSTLAAFHRPDDLPRLERLVDEVPYPAYREHVYRGVAVGQHAFSSALRATLRGTLLDDAESRWLYRRYLLTAMHVVDLALRAFEALEPDVLVAIHGVYVTHGTLCEVARNYGVRVVVYGVPYRNGTIWLSHDDSYHRTMVTESHEAWESTALSESENNRLDAYLDSKRGGGRDYFNYHPSPIEDRRKIIEELRLDPNKPVVSLFTNVLWDAQIYYDYNAFPNMLEWLYATVEQLGLRPEVQLVVRVHPAEVKGGLPTKQPIVPELQARFPTLPDNVRIVPPESDVSSYTLAEMSAAALIYGTKMGLEIAARGIPVVVAGETFNRGKGFTFDISSAGEYSALLQRVEKLPRNDAIMIERARRYANYLYFRRMMDFSLLEVAEPHTSTGLRLKFESVDALKTGRDQALDVLCRGILEGSPFYL